MIYTNAVITVKDYESSINKPIIIYRGDKNIEVMFEIKNSVFRQYKSNTTNTILDLNASYGQLVVLKPNNTYVISEITETKDGKIIFVIPPELIDELSEVGLYTFQIRLMNEDQTSRVTLPPVVDGIEIIEPIASEDEPTQGV
jgi:hypothetical protein